MSISIGLGEDFRLNSNQPLLQLVNRQAESFDLLLKHSFNRYRWFIPHEQARANGMRFVLV